MSNENQDGREADGQADPAGPAWSATRRDPNLRRPPSVSEADRRRMLALTQALNRRHQLERAGHRELAARMQSFELAARMQVEAMDRVDAMCADPTFHLSMTMRPGDMQFVNNYHVLHARDGYADDRPNGKVRHLKRLWLETRVLTD